MNREMKDTFHHLRRKKSCTPKRTDKSPFHKSTITHAEVEILKNLKLIVARTERGMTQGELAEAVGVTRQTVSLIEKGEYNPTLRLCTAICRALGKTLNDIFWEMNDDEKQ